MGKIITLFVFLTFIGYARLCAQDRNDTLQVQPNNVFPEETFLPSLAQNFYQNSHFIERNYEYEQTIKIQKVKAQSQDMCILAVIFGVGSYLSAATLSYENEWANLNFSIALGITIGLAFATPFAIMSYNLKKKEKNLKVLQITPVAQFDVGKQVSLGVELYSASSRFNTNGLGLNITAHF